MIVWGLWITLPFLPGDLAASGVYSVLLIYAPDRVWGVLSLTIGLAMGISIFRNGRWRWAAFLAFLWLFFLTALTAMGMLAATGPPSNAVLTLAALWVFFRTGAVGEEPRGD
jgi:hypothetical protein